MEGLKKRSCSVRALRTMFFFHSSEALAGRFCMVCRDVRGGSYDVPQLLLSTPEEKKLYEIGKGWCHCFVYLAGFIEPFGRRIPRETADRDQNGVNTGPPDICRGGGTSLVLSESGSIRGCIHSVSFSSAGESVDVRHPNRKIAAHVPPK